MRLAEEGSSRCTTWSVLGGGGEGGRGSLFFGGGGAALLWRGMGNSWVFLKEGKKKGSILSAYVLYFIIGKRRSF